MKKLSYLLAAMLLTIGIAHGQEETVIPEITGGDELVEEKGRFAETWVHPDADISQYNKLYLWHAVFQFREGGTESAGTTIERSRGSQEPFAVSEESRLKFEEIVSDTFVKVLTRSKVFEVVDEIGPGTLIVRVAMLDIVSNVPGSHPGTTDVYLSDVGEATFVFELIDAKTGVIQARTGERRTIKPRGRMNTVSSIPATSSTVWSEVRVWADQVAEDFRRALEKAYKRSQKAD